MVINCVRVSIGTKTQLTSKKHKLTPNIFILITKKRENIRKYQTKPHKNKRNDMIKKNNGNNNLQNENYNILHQRKTKNKSF